ncbi:MAG: Txe/YoeB family addiction module toxin [Propionibacteriaceae bacterium]|nr:Txe/YoeB family addiction module toxin [Propionibacteriaceae bacterium]
MRISFTPRGWEDYTHWATADRALLRRVNKLIEAAARQPTAGIGKPEPLKHRVAAVWSRRITEEHRLVYLVEKDQITILQARFHHDA